VSGTRKKKNAGAQSMLNRNGKISCPARKFTENVRTPPEKCDSGTSGVEGPVHAPRIKTKKKLGTSLEARTTDSKRHKQEAGGKTSVRAKGRKNVGAFEEGEGKTDIAKESEGKSKTPHQKMKQFRQITAKGARKCFSGLFKHQHFHRQAKRGDRALKNKGGGEITACEKGGSGVRSRPTTMFFTALMLEGIGGKKGEKNEMWVGLDERKKTGGGAKFGDSPKRASNERPGRAEEFKGKIGGRYGQRM